MTSGAETSHTFREKAREASKIYAGHTMNTEIFILCLSVFASLKKEVQGHHTSQIWTHDTQYFRERMVLSLNKETLIARKFPLYHAVLH